MLDFDFKKRYMKEEKDIASVENNKGYWNESYCCISENKMRCTIPWKVQS